MLDQIAAEAEMGAESRARRRLLGLARRQGWPEAVIETARGWQVVLQGKSSWERSAREWCPAVVVTAMDWLYRQEIRYLPGDVDN